ncbi:MAG: Dabb family protein [Planctomycetota bacterium]|nr:MAG: Dabb family protein [Planctomycetota bacterium]
MIIHTVYFWLKADCSEADRTRFQKALSMLGDIDSASAVWIGGPAATPARPVLDDTYDAALICMFADVAAHDAYQDHPIHHAFITECRDLWARVQVYDADAKGIG